MAGGVGGGGGGGGGGGVTIGAGVDWTPLPPDPPQPASAMVAAVASPRPQFARIFCLRFMESLTACCRARLDVVRSMLAMTVRRSSHDHLPIIAALSRRRGKAAGSIQREGGDLFVMRAVAAQPAFEKDELVDGERV